MDHSCMHHYYYGGVILCGYSYLPHVVLNGFLQDVGFMSQWHRLDPPADQRVTQYLLTLVYGMWRDSCNHSQIPR